MSTDGRMESRCVHPNVKHTGVANLTQVHPCMHPYTHDEGRFSNAGEEANRMFSTRIRGVPDGVDRMPAGRRRGTNHTC
eukprot:8703740-Pyramimonas_sp.AAC.1